MIFAICGLLAVAVILVLYASLGGTSASERRVRVPIEESRQRKRNLLALLLGLILPISGFFLKKMKLEQRIKRRLDTAHVNLTPAAFFNFKILLAALATAGTYFFFYKEMPAIVLVSALAGFFLPDMVITGRIAKRRNMITKLLPETVDLLGLCVEAGLDLTTAIRWVIEKVPPNPMTEELAFVLEEIKWGKPRNQALKDMANRINLMEFFSFVHALVQSDRMGTPVAEAFGIISEDTRLQRFRRGERIALKAPIKILIPLIFCILPVIAIVVAGPIIIRFSTGGLTSTFSGK